MDSVSLTFTLRDVPGRVHIRYGVNDDPPRWGYDVLQLPRGPERARGFPVMEATVEHSAESYGAWLGWIQIIHSEASGEREVSAVDTAPQLIDAGLPWAAWGVRPTLFDAPSTTDGDLRWRADTFLAATPDAVMTRRAVPLCGFSWGYGVHDEAVTITPLTATGPHSWSRAIPLLAGHCPEWSFGDRQ